MRVIHTKKFVKTFVNTFVKTSDNLRAADNQRKADNLREAENLKRGRNSEVHKDFLVKRAFYEKFLKIFGNFWKFAILLIDLVSIHQEGPPKSR